MKLHWVTCVGTLACGAVFGQAWNHDPNSPLGPQSWGYLGAYNAFATCGTDKQAVGTRQTPINIVKASAKVSELPALTFHYHETEFVVENLSHVVEVVNEAESVLLVGPSPADSYKLLQFHFHTPSEHTMDGVASQMELHLVHQNSWGELAVVGVMLNVDNAKANHAFDRIMNAAPYLNFGGGNTSSEAQGEIDPTELLPEVRTYYTYSGSLTTPPCSEGVHWYVMTNPVFVSSQSVSTFQRLLSFSLTNNYYRFNNRPVQALNGRPVLVSH